MQQDVLLFTLLKNFPSTNSHFIVSIVQTSLIKRSDSCPVTTTHVEWQPSIHQQPFDVATQKGNIFIIAFRSRKITESWQRNILRYYRILYIRRSLCEDKINGIVVLRTQ